MTKKEKTTPPGGKKDMIQIPADEFGTLCICALRYCQGRQSYMPSLVQTIVSEHLEELTEKDIDIMIGDCSAQRTFGSYGDEKIDKPGWLKWEGKLLKEKKDRTLGR